MTLQGTQEEIEQLTKILRQARSTRDDSAKNRLLDKAAKIINIDIDGEEFLGQEHEIQNQRMSG